jgi:hypothetical protein
LDGRLLRYEEKRSGLAKTFKLIGNYIGKYLKMSKENQMSSSSYFLRKDNCKSTDLKRRLFEIGIHNHQHHPFLPPPLINNALNSQTTLPNEHKVINNKPLKYHPSQSPPIIKNHFKEFQIRKSPKHIWSPSSKSK